MLAHAVIILHMLAYIDICQHIPTSSKSQSEDGLPLKHRRIHNTEFEILGLRVSWLRLQSISNHMRQMLIVDVD